MFRSSYRLPFRLAGIPLYIHISFLLILPLMVWGTAQNISILVQQPRFGLDLDPAAFSGWAAGVLGFIAVIGLFISVVLHELGHSLTARLYGVKVRRITLWFLGGVAEFEEMPRQRGAEAVVGIAGPIVSFILAALFLGLVVVIPRTAPSLWVVVYYLAAINLMLGLFNLLPALPMDGGRILRSLLALKLPHARATVIAGNVSKVMALGLALWGLIHFNMWMIVLAFFIFTAVKRETQQTIAIDLLRGLGVADLMTRTANTLPAAITVGQLSSYIFGQPHASFPIADEQGRVIGTVGTEQLQNLHPATPLWQVMSTQILAIPEHASALEAFALMNQNNLPRLIVLNDFGQLTGLITMSDLLRAIQQRMSNPNPSQPPTSVHVQRAAGAFPGYPPSTPVG